MSISRALHFNHRQRRTLVSSLFGLTFLVSVITVSASAVLPCPAHGNHSRYADGVARDAPEAGGKRRVTVVEKKPRRWIEETKPKAAAHPPPQSHPTQSEAQS